MYNGWGGGGRGCGLDERVDCAREHVPLPTVTVSARSSHFLFPVPPALLAGTPPNHTEPRRRAADASRGHRRLAIVAQWVHLDRVATYAPPLPCMPSPSPAPHQPLPVSARGCCRTLAPSGCMTGAPARRGSVAAAHTRPEPPHGIPRSGLRNLDRWLSLKGGKCAPGDMNHAGLLPDLDNVSKIEDTKVWSPRRAFQSLAAAPACPPTAEVMRPAGTGRPTAGPPHRLGCPRLERLGSPELPGAGPAVGRGCRCRVGSVGGRRTRRGASLSGWELSCRGGRQGGASGGGPVVVEHFVP